jgi:hypothetical protein
MSESNENRDVVILNFKMAILVGESQAIGRILDKLQTKGLILMREWRTAHILAQLHDETHGSVNIFQDILVVEAPDHYQDIYIYGEAVVRNPNTSDTDRAFWRGLRQGLRLFLRHQTPDHLTCGQPRPWVNILHAEYDDAGRVKKRRSC